MVSGRTGAGATQPGQKCSKRQLPSDLVIIPRVNRYPTTISWAGRFPGNFRLRLGPLMAAPIWAPESHHSGYLLVHLRIIRPYAETVLVRAGPNLCQLSLANWVIDGGERRLPAGVGAMVEECARDRLGNCTVCVRSMLWGFHGLGYCHRTNRSDVGVASVQRVVGAVSVLSERAATEIAGLHVCLCQKVPQHVASGHLRVSTKLLAFATPAALRH